MSRISVRPSKKFGSLLFCRFVEKKQFFCLCTVKCMLFLLFSMSWAKCYKFYMLKYKVLRKISFHSFSLHHSNVVKVLVPILDNIIKTYIHSNNSSLGMSLPLTTIIHSNFALMTFN